MDGRQIRLPEALRLPIDVLALCGLLFCFMGLLSGAMMGLEGNSREWQLSALLLVIGLALVAVKVLAHEWEKSGRVAFLSPASESEAVADKGLALPASGSRGGPLRPAGVASAEPAREPESPHNQPALLLLMTLAFGALPFAFDSPFLLTTKLARGVLALACVAAAGLIALKAWRFLPPGQRLEAVT